MGSSSDVRQLYGDDIPPNKGFILCRLTVRSCETRAFTYSIWYGVQCRASLLYRLNFVDHHCILLKAG